MITLEILSDSIESAYKAWKGGADRLELCASLTDGGITPSAGLVMEVKSLVDIPVFVMVRPRRGDFLYTKREFQLMKRELESVIEAGADGIVTGLLKPDGSIDVSRTRELVDMSGDCPVTFHRAFDMADSSKDLISQLKDTGIKRLLTSGFHNTAVEGIAEITSIVKEVGSDFKVMAGAGVTPENVIEIIKNTNVPEVHFSAKSRVKSRMEYLNSNVAMGAEAEDEYSRYEVNEEVVAKMKLCLKSIE